MIETTTAGVSRRQPVTRALGVDRWHGGAGPLDAWLRGGLADIYGAAMDEAVPEELRLLVNQITEF